MVTSLCIDSTGRAAYERGYQVSILADCCSARTPFEQEFFCENVFPLYANVINGSDVEVSTVLALDIFVTLHLIHLVIRSW
jgi:nicotinamidase-related amidase